MSGVILPIFVLGAGLGVYFFVLPKYQTLNENRTQLEAKRADLNSKKSSLSGVKSLVKSLDTDRDKLQQVEEALPAAPAVPELLANLDHLAQKSGMLVNNIEMTLPRNEDEEGGPRGSTELSRGERMDNLISSADNIGIIQIDMNLIGPYSNFKTFLQNLQQNMRLMDINSITSALGADEQGNQHYSIKVYSYYQK